ncbi:contact-dependent growth inhibition system immunity protein [Streptomyces scopuliridis]|uniref:contact-dependent growth inhibition system immunity protein n=1 Tax=Streptomyces scopuliridis TaxID=452529 RepID=UPI0036B0CFCF
MCFPETAQLLGGWFSQDIVDEFIDHDAAVADYATTTDPNWSHASWAKSTSCSPSLWTKRTTLWLPPNSAWRQARRSRSPTAPVPVAGDDAAQHLIRP